MLEKLKSALRQLAGGGDMPAVLRAAAQVVSIRLAAAGLNYALIVVLARHMGAAEFGTYAYALAYTLLLAVPSGLGLPGMTVRFIAAYSAAGDNARLRGLLTRVPRLALASGCVVGALWALAVLTVKGPVSDTRTLALLVAAAGVPVVVLANLGVQTGRGFGWMLAGFGPPQAGQAALAIACVLSATAIGYDLTAPRVLGIVVASYAVTTTLQRAWFAARLRPRFDSVTPVFDTRTWIRAAVPLMLFEGFASVMAHSDVIMVGLMMTPESTGHYQAAVRTAMLMTFIPQAMMSLGAPKIAGLHARGQAEEMQRFVNAVLPWIVIPSVLLAAGLYLFDAGLLGLFGEGFAEGSSSLRIIVAGYLAGLAFGPAHMVLNMTGHQDDCAKAYAGAAAANVLLNAALIPRLGTDGAALATAVSFAAVQGYLCLKAHRRLGISLWVRTTAGS